jgi:hypothetical protein
MYAHFALEATHRFRLSLELSSGNGGRRSNCIPDSLVQSPQELDRHDEVSNEHLDGRSHQGDREHTIIVSKVNLRGFKSLRSWSWKHLCCPKTMGLRKGSTKDTRGCESGRCSIGCSIPGSVGLPGYSTTNCIARKTQDFTPDARQDAASGHCTGSHDLPSGLCEFASNHGSSQHTPCIEPVPPTRGAHSEALPTHSAIMICRDVNTYRKGLKFRNINTLFHDVNGQPRGVLALQDTGADQNAIAEELVEELGYLSQVRKFTEADKSCAPRGLGGEPFCPSATIELQFSTLCGRTSGAQTFNVYKQHEIDDHEVILDVTLVEHLGHLRQVRCKGLCSLV